MDQVHEFISYTSNDGIPAERQAEVMEQIGDATTDCPGFGSHDFFYSDADRRWLAHVIREDEEAIGATATIAEDESVAELFDQIESESMTYGRFRRAGGVRGGQSLQRSA